MNETLTMLILLGSVVFGIAAHVYVWRSLIRRVDDGKIGRFRATLTYGAAAIPLAVAPLLFAVVTGGAASLLGFEVFGRGTEADGLLIMLAIGGAPVAMLSAGLFAVSMLLQALGGGTAPARPSAPPASTFSPPRGPRTDVPLSASLWTVERRDTMRR